MATSRTICVTSRRTQSRSFGLCIDYPTVPISTQCCTEFFGSYLLLEELLQVSFEQDAQCFLFIPGQLYEIVQVLGGDVLGVGFGDQGLGDSDEFVDSRP